MNEIRTHYDNLKVSREAPPEVIKAAYKALTQKYHPDRNPGDEEALRITSLLNGSYEVLIDPVKRKHHDQWIAVRESEDADGRADSEAMAGRTYPLRLSRGKTGIKASLLAFSRRRPLLTAALPGIFVASILSGAMLAQDRDAQRQREAQWVVWLTQARLREATGDPDDAGGVENGEAGAVALPSTDSAPAAYFVPEPVIITQRVPSYEKAKSSGARDYASEHASVTRAYSDTSRVLTERTRARDDTDFASKKRAAEAHQTSRATSCGVTGGSPAFQELLAEKPSALLYRYTLSDCGWRRSGDVFDIVEAVENGSEIRR